MNGVLGVGLVAGVLAGLWSLAMGAPILLAILAYSAIGTCASLLAGLVVMVAPGSAGPAPLTE